MFSKSHLEPQGSERSAGSKLMLQEHITFFSDYRKG